jgi:predicted alpha/beta superfamily hydrolase
MTPARLALLLVCALAADGCTPTHVRTDHTIESGIVGDTYDLVVYAPADGNGPFPWLVFQDGDYLPGLSEALRAVTASGKAPPVVVVGVAYQGGTTGIAGGLSDATMDRRARDFTGRAIEGIDGTGGAGDFQAFLAEELVPWVEEELPVIAGSGGRATHGFSAFGLSVLYGVLTRSETFAGHCAGSPSVSTDDRFVFDLEEAAEPADVAGWLQVTSGTAEQDHAAVEEFADQVEARGYADLELLRAAWQGKDHRGSARPAFEACLAAMNRLD